MKKLIPFFALLLAGGIFLNSCSKDMGSSPSEIMPMSTTTTADAHPAWTYVASAVISKKTYYTVAVSDSDGTDAANVYTSASTTNRILTPTWSSSGGSVSFVEGPTSAGWGAYSIKAVDVSVSGGVASGSNSRTIYSNVTSDSLKVRAQAWSQLSSVAKIAFVGQTPTGYGIYTVSTSGGSATKIYSAASSSDIIGASLAWSNDGTQITFAYKSGSNSPSIKVIDASTGTEDVNLTTTANFVSIGNLAWSHSGSDKIAFSATTSTSGAANLYNVYTIATTSGSTESLIHNGITSFWSPDNSELVMTIYDASNNAITTKVTVGTGGTTTVGTAVRYGDWKQP